VVGVGQEPKFEDGVTTLPLSLTGARTTPANDGQYRRRAASCSLLTRLGSSETQPWLQGPKCNGVQYAQMEVANAHIHVFPKLD
jgi:hypothetical protein